MLILMLMLMLVLMLIRKSVIIVILEKIVGTQCRIVVLGRALPR